MAADLFKDDPFFQSLVEAGSNCVGEDLRTLCLRGPEKRLRQSAFLQPLVVAVSLGYLRRLRERGVAADLVLGHSLGEITALSAAGAISAVEAVTMAACRGRFMEEAAASVDGTMMAVMGMGRDAALVLLAEAGSEGRVTLANDNAPNQVVLSGERSELESVARRISSGRLGACRFLSVTGPWHSPYMKTASSKFEEWVAPREIGRPSVPVVMNVSGRPADEPETIRRNIVRAVAEPVQWRSTMEYLKNAGTDELVEVGPGRVLAGLARINGFGNEARVFTVNDLRGVETAAAALAPART